MQQNKFLHSVSAIRKCYNCIIKPMNLHVIYRLVKQMVTAWSTVKNLNWLVPPLPTCRRSVKRISANFALLCLSDIMIKILKESQFTVESESHGECFLLILDAPKMGSGLTGHWWSLIPIMGVCERWFFEMWFLICESRAQNEWTLLGFAGRKD